VWAKILQSQTLAILGGQETGLRATRGTRPTDPPAGEWLQRFEAKLKQRRTKGSLVRAPIWQGLVANSTGTPASYLARASADLPVLATHEGWAASPSPSQNMIMAAPDVSMQLIRAML
jgi:hypothetical protein